jgi:CubicO group peptidase (beta-lactamase class C family)
MRQYDLPSVAVVVVRDGSLLWEEAFGWADRERRLPAGIHTPYSLASVTKPITATALMHVVGQGSIDLDTPVNEYLGDARLKARVRPEDNPTVRQVCSHAAGLPLHHHFFPQDGPHEPPSMEQTILRYGNLVTSPGETYQYSNLGYAVLDYLISRSGGCPYEVYVQREVFRPLGMNRSAIGLPSELVPIAAARYDTDGRRLPGYGFDHSGASAAYSSAHDLGRFMLFHLGDTLPDQRPPLSQATTVEMREPVIAITDSSGYALGWRVSRVGKSAVTAAHTGSMPGVSTIVQLVPSEGLGVSVLSNARSHVPEEICRGIVDLLLPGFLPEPQSPQQIDTVGSNNLAPLAGTWSGTIQTTRRELPWRLVIEPDGPPTSRIGDQLETLVNEPTFRSDAFVGKMMGRVDTEDTVCHPYTLLISLRQRGEVMNGAVTAISDPDVRLGSALSHWAEVSRAANG